MGFTAQRQVETGAWLSDEPKGGKGVPSGDKVPSRKRRAEGPADRPPEDADRGRPTVLPDETEASEPQALLSPKSRDANQRKADPWGDRSGLWGAETLAT